MSYQFPLRRLVSQEDSAMIRRPDVPRSRFINRYSRKHTQNAGLLVPFLVEEVLPGDVLRYNVTAMVRMATPIVPIMDSQRVDTHFFFVPCRLVWDDWRRFMGEQSTPSQSIDIQIPFNEMTRTQWDNNPLYDYLGIPRPGGAVPVQFSNLPVRAYHLIWYEWFRDQDIDLQGPPPKGGNGLTFDTFQPVFRRAKSHDYFTSCRPWPQKFTAPTIPLTGRAPVFGIYPASGASTTAGPQGIIDPFGNVNSLGQHYQSAALIMANTAPLGSGNAVSPTNPRIYADLSSTLANISINAFRQAMQVQALLERDAQGGTRYTELLTAHFGVRSPDARLQRPEYIGGGSTPLEVTPVAQTAAAGTNPIGTLGAAATSMGQHRASFASTEHGYVIGICSIKSELSYSEGLHRMWSRRTRNDFFWPSLAQLGEQAVLNQELWLSDSTTERTAAFGFQERWHEYRTMWNTTAGKFRTDVPATLSVWHLGQNFAGNTQLLNSFFIEDRPPMERVLVGGAAVTTDRSQYLCDFEIMRDATRPVPQFGDPARLGRF